jgi:hypothetical protein
MNLYDEAAFTIGRLILGGAVGILFLYLGDKALVKIFGNRYPDYFYSLSKYTLYPLIPITILIMWIAIYDNYGLGGLIAAFIGLAYTFFATVKEIYLFIRNKIKK